MTEKEAIKVIKKLVFCGMCTTGPCGDCERKLAKDMALSALEEIQQYRAIGTVEECREAREKREPKKIVPDGAFGECPCCGEPFNSELIGEYEMRFCIWCGQALNLGE